MDAIATKIRLHGPISSVKLVSAQDRTITVTHEDGHAYAVPVIDDHKEPISEFAVLNHPSGNQGIHFEFENGDMFAQLFPGPDVISGATRPRSSRRARRHA